MIACIGSNIVIEYVKLLDKVCGMNPLIVTRGKVHKYLEIIIDFRLKRGVAIN
jgi:hypothetical protein